MHARILLYLSNQCPVCLACVHLAAGTAVDGQGLDAHVLQSLGQFHDDLRVLVPSQAGLDSHGKFHGLHDLACDLYHLIRFTHHARAGTATCDLVDRASEVDVHKVCTMASCDLCGLLRHLGCIHHRLRYVSVNLDSDRGFVIICNELLEGFSCIADQSV